MSSGLGFASAVFALVAGWFLYVGFTMEVTIDGTANLQLMHMQSANIAIGIGSAVVSAMLAVGSAIVAVIQAASAPPE